MWALHHADEEVEEESSDGEAPEPEMFFLADRALSAAYFPAPAEEATAVDTDTAVMSLRNSLVYLPADTIMPSDGLDTFDPPADI